MDKTFNELFDEFFKKNNIKPEDKLSDAAKNDAKKIVEFITKDDNITKLDENAEKQLDEELGKPDRIEFYNEGNIFFEKRIWYTPNGEIYKSIVTDDPSMKPIPVPQKTLKQKLDEAVEAERFEEAAAIRDILKKRKNIENKLK